MEKPHWTKVTGCFGDLGGQYVPEAMKTCLAELEAGFNSAVNDPGFWKEYHSYGLSDHARGADIWLKREDLNHTGSYKINNALETGAGHHGYATANVCVKFGMKCTIFMGADNIRRQALNVARIRLFVNLNTTHFIIGLAVGPHPFPTTVRTFQSVIGDETKSQMKQELGKLPDAVVLIGVEAGGDGLNTSRHSASLSSGSVGVLYGVRIYVLQDQNGQISDSHSVSVGLNYPGAEPELANLKYNNRATFLVATDNRCLRGFSALNRL
ncbi:tryptophan synthase beta subunit-like PLP-dependent enzyme [Aspergillus alliaceus]|uniref:tryptophan synthase beta subunit-like PLP-dependent enzyme n=1 Tax=Petromyces alliaceus TaxID=209559 RepID=UPI0012A454FE|nr:tryptophan synthase beta subunit-like PLP-dependent enzyme [Aspergillus alliaceus]KAB8237605.1 tryptophan synthase beta subunit-like PLP-dependent enzyme [Aspergillus alliaceus]